MFSSARPGKSNPKQRIQNSTAFPSSSSSSSASSCSSPPLSPPETATRAPTMEELWKDINPSPLHHPHNHHTRHHGHPSSSAAARHGTIFQDFLGPPPPAAMLGHPGGHYHPGSHSMLASAAVDPPPATLLSLNSGMEFHFPEGSSPLRSSSGSGHLQSGLTNVVSSASFNNGWPFDASANCAPVMPCFGSKKRTNDPETETGDRRHKRMIKNRESAARSRARKQAYTNELELEVAHLNEEIAKLQKQHQQLCMAAGAQVAKKHTLQRSTTAPF